jgi:hypothetical protein
MRSLLAILIFFALAEPAAACRRFSIWHYDFPQPCPIARAEARAALAPAAPDFPLPDLTESTCRETGDGRFTAIGSCGSRAAAANSSLAVFAVRGPSPLIGARVKSLVDYDLRSVKE